MVPFYSSISMYACQPLQTVSISCIKEHIPREIWGNVSSDVLLSHKELSVFQRYKALAGKAWDEMCEFRRWSSAHSVIKVCHTFSVIIPKRHSDLKCDTFRLWRLLLCKAWFHPLNYMLYCDTVSEIFLQLWRYVLKMTETMQVIVLHTKLKKLIGVFIIKVFLCITQCSDCTWKDTNFFKNTKNTRNRCNKTDVTHRSNNHVILDFWNKWKMTKFKMNLLNRFVKRSLSEKKNASLFQEEKQQRENRKTRNCRALCSRGHTSKE